MPAEIPSVKPALKQANLDEMCIKTIRCLAMDGVEKARSGHPGMPMGAAPMAYVLWTRHLRHNPRNPKWLNRDRFILSAGHGSMLLYSLLHLTGYDLALDDLKQFRQFGSKTPGHPENLLVEGIETTTGPLGQGFATGVGMAIAEKYLAVRFNREGHELVNYKIYSIVSDGDLMEGISHEAASLAGHLGLDNIIYLYDDNHISIEGSTDLAFTEDAQKRFEAYGWFVQRVGDGNDLAAIDKAIRAAQAQKGKPSIIMVRTHIAYGAPHAQDTAEAHGAPLGDEEIKLTKQFYGWPTEEKFLIPDEALSEFRKCLDRGREGETRWQQEIKAYKHAFTELAVEWDRFAKGELPAGWKEKFPVFKPSDGAMATRQAFGKVLAAIAPSLPTLVGGSADLAPSNNTYVKGHGDFSKGNYGARNLHFGVREHAMGAALNGMALSGLIPYGGTFLIFSDYARPAVRLAALMEARSIFVFTHDSIFLGEDGPTHQPVEHLAALRAMPNLMLLRPADANETVVAWRIAIEHHGGPVAILLTRQGLPIFDRSKYASAEGVTRGAYVLADPVGKPPEIILMGTGSEVYVALEASEKLAAEGIAARVVSMPSWDIFEKQPQQYKDEVLPPAIANRLAIEAASPFGWDRYVGAKGAVLGVNRFGASAPWKVLAEKFGLASADVIRRVKKLLGR